MQHPLVLYEYIILAVRKTSTSTSTRGVYSGCTRNGARQVRVRYSGAERRAMPLPRWHFPHVRSAVGGGRCWTDPCCFRVLKVKENGRGVEGAVLAAAAVETSCTPRPPRHRPPRSPERAERSWPFRRPNDQFLIPDFLCSRASLRDFSGSELRPDMSPGSSVYGCRGFPGNSPQTSIGWLTGTSIIPE